MARKIGTGFSHGQSEKCPGSVCRSVLVPRVLASTILLWITRLRKSPNKMIGMNISSMKCNSKHTLPYFHLKLSKFPSKPLTGGHAVQQQLWLLVHRDEVKKELSVPADWNILLREGCAFSVWLVRWMEQSKVAIRVCFYLIRTALGFQSKELLAWSVQWQEPISTFPLE